MANKTSENMFNLRQIQAAIFSHTQSWWRKEKNTLIHFIIFHEYEFLHTLFDLSIVTARDLYLDIPEKVCVMYIDSPSSLFCNIFAKDWEINEH